MASQQGLVMHGSGTETCCATFASLLYSLDSRRLAEPRRNVTRLEAVAGIALISASVLLDAPSIVGLA